MAIHSYPGLGLTGGFPNQYKGWGDPMNANLRLLSAATQLMVLDRVAALPGSPTDGDKYLLTATAEINRIAVRDEGNWVYFPPSAGWLTYVLDEDLVYVWDGTAWGPLETTPIGGPYQPLDADLTAIAALTTTAYGRGLLTLANVAALKVLLAYTAADIVNVPAGTIAAGDVQAALNELDTEKAALAGATFTGVVAISKAASPFMTMDNAGGGNNAVGSYAPNSFTFQTSFPTANAVQMTLRKSRGDVTTPAFNNLNDGMWAFRGEVWSGAGTTFIGPNTFFGADAAEAQSAVAQGSRLRFVCTPVGVVSSTSAAHCVMTLNHENGLCMFGTTYANPVIDQNMILRPRSYTIATLPAVPATGIIYCSDLGGGGGNLTSNGTVWTRENRGVATIASDAAAAFTWTYLTSAHTQYLNTPITAARAVALSTTNVPNGARARFARTSAATGAFNWNIGTGPLKALTLGTWCEVEFNGTAWVLTSQGNL